MSAPTKSGMYIGVRRDNGHTCPFILDATGKFNTWSLSQELQIYSFNAEDFEVDSDWHGPLIAEDILAWQADSERLREIDNLCGASRNVDAPKPEPTCKPSLQVEPSVPVSKLRKVVETLRKGQWRGIYDHPADLLDALLPDHKDES